MPVPVTALYAALLAIVGMTLVFLVGRVRGPSSISLGDGGNRKLLEAMRRHANWVESVPLFLVLLLVLELNGTPKGWLHGLGLVMLAGRIVHPFGLDADVMMRPARFVGMLATLLPMAAAVLLLLWQSLARW